MSGTAKAYEDKNEDEPLLGPGAVDGEVEKEPEKPAVPTSPEAAKAARYKSFRIRTVSTVAMILAFILINYLGHVPLVMLVFTLQFLMVRELFSLARHSSETTKLPGFRLQQWYFFLVAAFYLYLRFIKNNLLVEVTSNKKLAHVLGWVLKRHTMLSYLLYVAGFVSFVLSLKRGSYMYQFSQYAWTHMTLLVIFVPSSFFVSSIFSGIIWFLLPTFLIIANDIFAYLAGFFWGKTPLIKLSPKKTWEGFFGGLVGTLIFSFCLATLMSKFQWMVCPRKDLSLGPLHCVPDEIFTPRNYQLADVALLLPSGTEDAGRVVVLKGLAMLPEPLHALLGRLTFKFAPFQFHAMALAIFASIIAPFGGFFASGFKRAINKKDFGDTIPGHGGIIDRFDCQMMMAMFAYVYYVNFVSPAGVSVGDVLDQALELGPQEQVELFAKLGNLLAGEGLLPDTLADGIVSYWNANH